MSKQVTVTRWCANPADSFELMQMYVDTDAGAITGAIRHVQWISPCIRGADADAFEKGIIDNGGNPFTTPCPV